jgi:hypothetical protein
MFVKIYLSTEMSAIDAPIAEEVRHEGGRRRLVAEDQS